LDEATASVDGDTDARIQHMLRNSPHLCGNKVTILSVAHRLNTVMDFDNILVLDRGVAAEFGKPSVLLANKKGALSKLVDATGPANSEALRLMAANALPPSSLTNSPTSPSYIGASSSPPFKQSSEGHQQLQSALMKFSLDSSSLASVTESSLMKHGDFNHNELELEVNQQHDADEEDLFMKPFG
jgi:ABC-type multidrug transport system ATPase subunit